MSEVRKSNVFTRGVGGENQVVVVWRSESDGDGGKGVDAWCQRGRPQPSTEMQENTWARLRESSTHQAASHAT